jgi:hypothetical protein
MIADTATFMCYPDLSFDFTVSRFAPALIKMPLSGRGAHNCFHSSSPYRLMFDTDEGRQRAEGAHRLSE